MVFNGYSGIAAFAAVLRVALGVLLLVAAVRSLSSVRSGLSGISGRRAPRRASGAGSTGELGTDGAEAGYYLRFILGATLLGTAVAAWPLFFLVLQSYVGLWPDVMCIDGVTRIGTGSANASVHLPGLIAFLEISKPALIFVAGVWMVFHILMRTRVSSRIRAGSMATLIVFGLLGTADGVVEGAYLFIPKQEQALATGCCTVGSQPTSFVASAEDSIGPSTGAGEIRAQSVGGDPRIWSFFGIAALVIVALSFGIHRMHARGAPGVWLAVSALGAAVLVPVGIVYLRDVAAPLFLRLPYHPCAYCLVGSAPESLVGVALFAAAIFSVGWASIARGLDRTSLAIAAPLLRFARFGFLATLLMVGVRMVSA
jgi:hypothetical protein